MDIKVLVVDDSAVMRRIILKNLRQAGFNLISALEAMNGEDALSKFSTDIDIVISDLHMPTMDGCELTKRIRALSTTIPILMITAEGSEEKMNEAKACGVNDYLNKPPSIAELIEKITPLLK